MMMNVIYFFSLLVFSSFSLTMSDDSGRIVGGYNAEDGEFPYQISLRHLGRHICGGSIIDHNWILTAAHCVDGQKPDNFTIVTGSNDLEAGGDVYPLETIIQHEKFNSNMIKNDIALIKTKDEITYNDKVKSVKLPITNTNCDQQLTLSGWGRTSYPGEGANKLQAIKLFSISNTRCMLEHPILGAVMGGVSSTNICTFTKEGEGACHGDSGGPLVNGEYQVGVVSWGIPCAKGKPDVFTRVYSYLDWLEQHMKKETTVKSN